MANVLTIHRNRKGDVNGPSSCTMHNSLQLSHANKTTAAKKPDADDDVPSICRIRLGLCRNLAKPATRALSHVLGKDPQVFPATRLLVH